LRQELQIKGDTLVAAISAASILAKVTRDRWCDDIDVQYPAYGFAQHKGYGTAQHLAALCEHGACPHHRTTFRPVREVIHRSAMKQRTLQITQITKAYT
jgi:ribonuclease HII